MIAIVAALLAASPIAVNSKGSISLSTAMAGHGSGVLKGVD
ncbi:hypothetical protein QMZ05_29245 [Bradyrhizobium sp. INPA03-11B]